MSTSEKTSIYKVTLLSCFDNCAPTCLMASLCWCFPFAQIVNSAGVDTHCFGLVGSGFWQNIALGAVSYIVGYILNIITNQQIFTQLFCFIIVFTLRRGYRLKKEIKDEPYSCPVAACAFNSPLVDDCCVSLWCMCCALTQMQRNEMEYEGFCDCAKCGPAFCPPEAGAGGDGGDAPADSAPAGGDAPIVAEAGASDGSEPNKV